MTSPFGPPSSARQFLVKVEGIEGYWSQKSGGNITSDASKAYDGGSLQPDIITAPPQAENITVMRNYKPSRDAALMSRLRQLVGSWSTTVSVTPTDAAMVAIAPPTVYAGAVLVGLTEPESDASSGDASTFGLEFAVANYR